MNMVSSLFIAGFYEYFTEVAEILAKKFNWPGIETMLEVKPSFFLISGLFYASTIAGALLMFHLKKAGIFRFSESQNGNENKTEKEKSHRKGKSFSKIL